MVARRRLMLLPAGFLVIVLLGAGIAFNSTRGNGDRPAVAPAAEGPDVGSSAQQTAQTVPPPSPQRALDDLGRALEQSIRAEQDAQSERDSAALAYALARAQDEQIAAAAMDRWGRGGVLLSMPSIDTTASVERAAYERDGRTPATPNTPWGVAWYTFTDAPGSPGNAVFSGHVDWYTGAPAVFGRLRQLVLGDSLYVVLADGTPVVYLVERSELVTPEAADVAEIFGSTDREAVTLITCGGTWNPVTQDYSHRLIVRAYRVR